LGTVAGGGKTEERRSKADRYVFEHTMVEKEEMNWKLKGKVTERYPACCKPGMTMLHIRRAKGGWNFA